MTIGGVGVGVEVFVDIFGGVTSNFDNFYVCFFKINYSNLCSL